ncbi:LPXTG cell wall anchor domain-containing protein [Streptomyces sp. NPDC001970]
MAATAASLIAAAPLVVAEPAFAQPYPPSQDPTIIGDNTLAPGDEADFQGTGFQGGEGVLARLVPVGAGAAGAAGAAAFGRSAVLPQSFAAARPTPTATTTSKPTTAPDSSSDGRDERRIVEFGTWTAATSGIVTGTITIPKRTAPGRYDFQLVGQLITLTAPVTVLDDKDDDHGRPGHGDGDDDDHGRPGHGDGDDDDHGRPGHGDGDDDDHGRPGHGDGDDDDHGRPGSGDDDSHERSGHDDDRDHSGGDDNGDDHGSSDDDDDDSSGSSLADTGSPEMPGVLLTAAGGLVLLGGGALVLVKRRRSAARRG